MRAHTQTYAYNRFVIIGPCINGNFDSIIHHSWFIEVHSRINENEWNKQEISTLYSPEYGPDFFIFKQEFQYSS